MSKKVWPEAYCGPAPQVVVTPGLRVSIRHYGSSAAIAAEVAAVATAGSYAYSANAQSQANNYQAAVASNNQKIAAYNASIAAQQGQQQESEKKRQTTEMQGRERAAFGANNLEADSGSPLRLQQDTARLGDTDVMTIRSNTARSVFGYEVAGMNYGAQAELDKAEAQNVETAGALNAFTSLVGGASEIGPKWRGWQNDSLTSPKASLVQ